MRMKRACVRQYFKLFTGVSRGGSRAICMPIQPCGNACGTVGCVEYRRQTFASEFINDVYGTASQTEFIAQEQVNIFNELGLLQ